MGDWRDVMKWLDTLERRPLRVPQISFYILSTLSRSFLCINCRTVYRVIAFIALNTFEKYNHSNSDFP